MFKVVITDYIGPEVEVEKSIIGDLAEIEPLLARSIAELEGKVDDADAMLEIRTKTAMEVARALRGDKLANCINSQWLSSDVRERVLIGIPPTV